MRTHLYRTISVLLVFVMAGMTEVAQAWQTQTAAPGQQQTTTPAQQQSTTPTQTTATPAQQQNPTPATQQPDAQTQQAQPQPEAQTPDTSAQPAKENNASDPTHVPAPGEVLPNAPSTQESQGIPATENSAPVQQKKDQQPLGTAAAEKGVTTGGAASKPAGIAVAGKKQNQSRGLLIKVGAALAAGAALGTVYALSRSTSPTPPGAR